MNIEPKKAYVYQPMAPTADGKFYGVGGLGNFGLTYEEASIKGITKSDAEEIVRVCNESPEFAANFVRGIKKALFPEAAQGKRKVMAE